MPRSEFAQYKLNIFSFLLNYAILENAITIAHNTDNSTLTLIGAVHCTQYTYMRSSAFFLTISLFLFFMFIDEQSVSRVKRKM